jgi:ABC-type branched-subunit amino acid transport system substrate-binding protein
MAAPLTDAWRLAVVAPFQGPAGMFGPSCQTVTELAVHELNSASGVAGREVSVEWVDGGDQPVAVGARIRQLIAQERIDAVTGWHISSVRQAIARETEGKIPYAYTSLYEGGERRKGVYCLGETPGTQIAPALEWLRDELGLRRWLVVGDDYIWPRLSSRAVRRFGPALGLDVVGERFVPYGSGRISQLVDLAERTECDGVIMLLVGQHAVEFNRLFVRRGLDERLVRYSPLMEENMLLASGARATGNLYVSASYFRSLATADSLDLVSAYTRLHGPSAPPLNNMAESCYEGIRFLAHAARKSQPGTASPDEFSYSGPRGTVSLDGGNASLPVHIAAASGLDFDILASF